VPGSVTGNPIGRCQAALGISSPQKADGAAQTNDAAESKKESRGICRRKCVRMEASVKVACDEK
jgi:hypothetical protein